MLKDKLIAALAALATALGAAGSAQADTQTFGANYGWATVFVDGGSDWMHATVDGQTATSACTYVGIEVERPGLNWKTKVARACAPRDRNVTVHHDMYHYGLAVDARRMREEVEASKPLHLLADRRRRSGRA